MRRGLFRGHSARRIPTFPERAADIVQSQRILHHVLNYVSTQMFLYLFIANKRVNIFLAGVNELYFKMISKTF